MAHTAVRVKPQEFSNDSHRNYLFAFAPETR